MLVAGGAAIAMHLACGLVNGKRCDPGRLMIFAGSAAGTVAGVYVFFEALRATLSTGSTSHAYQNSVWAGLGGLAVSAFTLDLLISEIRLLLKKPVEPIMQPSGDAEARTSAKS